MKHQRLNENLLLIPFCPCTERINVNFVFIIPMHFLILLLHIHISISNSIICYYCQSCHPSSTLMQPAFALSTFVEALSMWTQVAWVSLLCSPLDWICRDLFILLPVYGYVGNLQFLVLYDAAMKFTTVHTQVRISLQCIHGSRIAGSQRSLSSTFSDKGNLFSNLYFCEQHWAFL
jgi:Na+/melibiose symporter-like transporter